MKKLDNFLFWIIIASLVGAMINIAMADTGWDQAPRIERGHSFSVREVSLSSFTGTNIFPASQVRADGMCRNNSGFTIWVGTDTGTYQAQTHPNILNGFPS